MEFDLTQSQRMLRDSALEWLAGNVPKQVEMGECQDRWASFAAMGWLGVPFAEADGGFGGNEIDIGVLMFSLGQHLAAQSYASAIVVSGYLLAHHGRAQQRADLIPPMISGKTRLAFAHSEPGNPWPWSERSLRAVRRSDGSWVLNGLKQLVEDANEATHWLVSALCEDHMHRVFLVRPHHEVSVKPYTILAGGKAADLRFDEFCLHSDAVLGDANQPCDAVLSAAISRGMLAQAWAACGVMEMLVQQTVGHVQQRRQFGQALSSLQSVQHKLAEMQVEFLQAQAMCELFSMRASELAPLSMETAAAVKTRVARAADVVGKHAIQLHGAMGVCNELPVAPSFRWLEYFKAQFSRAEMHASKLGISLLDSGTYAHSAVLECQS